MDHYEILGIASNASSKEITFAYRRLALQYHPDRNKTPLANDMMLRINTSYSILSDPNKRREYDASRNRTEIQYAKYDSKAKKDIFNESNAKKNEKEPFSSFEKKIHQIWAYCAINPKICTFRTKKIDATNILKLMTRYQKLMLWS